jgi:hypothetical protein
LTMTWQHVQVYTRSLLTYTWSLLTLTWQHVQDVRRTFHLTPARMTVVNMSVYGEGEIARARGRGRDIAREHRAREKER